MKRPRTRGGTPGAGAGEMAAAVELAALAGQAEVYAALGVWAEAIGEPRQGFALFLHDVLVTRRWRTARSPGGVNE